MISGLGFNIRKIILSLLICPGVTFSLYSQEALISGVINQYRHVVSIGVNDNVTVTDASIFKARDTVLLIQMKGAIINVPENGYYGTYQLSAGSPGAYEFLIIQSVNTGTDNIIFTRNVLNSYDVDGMVQLIKVPYFNSAIVNSKLTCEPWDSTAKTGGVIALIVGGNLSLNADIDATGYGFIGGNHFVGTGICTSINNVLYDKYSYPTSFMNSGYKGEGLAIRTDNGTSLFPDYAKGKGNNYTAGGGGNGRFSGGGGGASIGTGGNGGMEANTCPPIIGDGGIGGKSDSFGYLDSGIFMGSGGGSSTFETGATTTRGGNGGGIIIILSDTLKGNGRIIKANGMKPPISTTGNAGAGGGGGGGSVAIYQQSFSSKLTTSALTISVIGGNGGDANANNTFGEGGGGGGGLILTNNLTFPDNVDTLTTGGLVGTRKGGSTGTSGKHGKSLTVFSPLLNGFLFNTIRSSLSNKQVDSVCSNIRPPKIIGTKPVGGSGTYTFQWQKSYESTFASPVVLTNDVDPTNYTPTLADAITPTDTVWFRRIVVDAGAPPITDISKAVRITVHQAISNNKIGNPDTICFNGDPPLIKQLLPPDLIVPSTTYLFYTWQDSSLSGTWGTTIGTGKEYNPAPGLVKTTKYRRIVTSGSCIDTSRVVQITVLPVITGNTILSPPQDICFGTLFNNLIATTTATSPALGGGDITDYRYKWISNINDAGWSNAPPPNNQSGYNPVEQAEKIPLNKYYFRRIVYSGKHDACFDTTSAVLLRDFPAITNNTINTITANLPICSGSAPLKITGPQPSNGNGVFTYTWQDSTNSSTQWIDIPGFVNITNPEYQPPVLTATTSFRRIANSSACSNISNSIKIIVHPSISNNSISLAGGGPPDTTICNGQTPHRLIGTPAAGGNGIYSYQWLDSTASKNLTPITGATQINYPNPSSLNVSTYYKRQVISGGCISKSSTTITITVLPPISNNIVNAGHPAVCENTTPDPVTGSSVTGGSGSYLYLWEQSTDGGANWVPAEGTNTLDNYQPPVLTNAIKYRRKVSSGFADCCTSTSPEADISINPAPQGPVYAGVDASIYSLERSYIMNADPPVVPGETGFWTALEPGTSIIDNVSDSKTEVRNLSSGQNLFVWSITNGLCNIDDSVNIELLQDLIPQGFSPNGDAWNNTFIIEGLNLSDQQIGELTILNGAGIVVYTTSNRDGLEWINWDGRNNKGNELPDGTYYYLLKITTPGKQVIKKSGFVELKRY